MAHTEAIEKLRRRYPGYSVREDEVHGIPIWMFYTIYPGDDPSAPHPYIEDSMFFTAEGIRADWILEDEEEVKRMEDAIFARGKQR